ncbi:hypothetical protein [Salegentibacter chungangensis]|uniref:DUF4175 domain-containing protein n=1 Tax=Salegentibacter chungangensis TaxID=1335724 RepID=A0ABW3NQU1_9FLAO
MKSLNLILLITGFFLLLSCEMEKKVNGIPTEAEDRAELYEEIINNEEYFIEFMDQMHENQGAMMNMRQHRGMMDSMMGGKGMRNFMERPKMRRNMMNMMMDDTTAMSDMLQMMKKREMMNEECEQMLRKRMREKGTMTDTTKASN